uniref:Uncharacterized protein n=1 Tax=Arundo donax TaxID=35708 RepID=A0A0A9ER00_ARUDO
MSVLNGVLELTGRTASTWKLDALSKLLPLHQHLRHSTKTTIPSFLDHFIKDTMLGHLVKS